MQREITSDVGSWSSKFGEYPAGDPELHHVAGTLYADGELRLRVLAYGHR
jgi:hypothetical protein